MLEKKPGNFRVDKLRAILLYEADFNNKFLGRAMMRKAELLLNSMEVGRRCRLLTNA